jgi:PAS domain S-box-containing protein
MKLLITGATGFIGSRLALRARKEGRDVVVAGLTNTNAESMRLVELEAAGLAVHKGALQDPRFAHRIVQGCDVVVHLAAAQHEANVPDSYFHSVNVHATRTLIDASCDAGVRRFVYGSTIGVYGSAADGELDEESPTHPENTYGRTKLEAEGVVRSYADKISTTIVRISETYGPGDFRLLKLFRAIDRGLFIMIGSGLNQRQIIHVQDLVRGLLLVGEHPAAIGQTFVFAGRERTTTRDMMKEIAAALGRPPPSRHAPMAPFVIAAMMMEKILQPLGIQPPLHRRRLDFFRKSFLFSTGKAASLLGFTPAVSFADGARETASWYREYGHLRKMPSQAAELSLREPDVPLATYTQTANEQRPWQHSDLLEYTHDAIIIWEMDGAGIVYWNRAAEQLYGYGRAEVRGMTTHGLLKTRLEGGVSQLEETIARYGIWVGELRHTARDGRQVDVQGRLALMAQHTGRWLVLEVNRDVTDLKQAEAAQKAAEAQLSSLKRRVQLD